MRCFSGTEGPAGARSRWLIVVMTQCRNLGLIDEVQSSPSQECELYREEMIHQLAYFHNVIIDSKYPNPIILLLTFSLKELKEEILNNCWPTLAGGVSCQTITTP